MPVNATTSLLAEKQLHRDTASRRECQSHMCSCFQAADLKLHAVRANRRRCQRPALRSLSLTAQELSLVQDF